MAVIEMSDVLGEPLLKKFISQLKRAITNHAPNICLAAVFGSRVRGDFTTESDIDLLVILCKEDEPPNEWLKRYISFIKVLNRVKRAMGDTLVIVPMNLLKEFLRYISKEEIGRYPLVVHLFLYLSSNQFIATENPWVVYGICEDAKACVIYGEPDILDAIISRIKPNLTFEASWRFLLQRLIQSHVCIEYAELPKELLVSFGKDMLKYCLLHLAKTILISAFGLHFRELLMHEDVYKNIRIYNIDLLDIVRLLKPEGALSLDQLKEAYRRLFRKFLISWELYGNLQHSTE